jgi:hypothetical protein
MTDRKPPGVNFESWVDRQIREAEARGEFADLWWVKRKMAREGLSVLPPALALRKEAEDAHEAALAAPTERAARKILEDVNVRIRDMMYKPPPGPPLGRKPFDVEGVLAERRARRG